MISTDLSHKKKAKKRKSHSQETGDDEVPGQLLSINTPNKKKKVDLGGEITPDETTRKIEKAKKKRKTAASNDDSKIQEKSSSEHDATESPHRKRKSKDKSTSADANASILNDSASGRDTSIASHYTEEDSAVKTKKKKKDRRDKTKNEVQSSVSVDGKADICDPVSPDVKKSKKEKTKLIDESSLGVVNTDILQQAEINLGLPMVDKLEKNSDVHSPDTTNTSVGEESVKKKKKKKKDKTQTEVQETNTPNEKNRNDRALEYLRLWGSNRQAWKFNKMFQVQLLHIMYDQSLVSNEDFETLLLYLDGMKGKGRDKTKESAKKILDEGETGTTDADKEERARQIFQMLS